MFKEILDKLSIASKEAVIDGTFNGLDEFKDYLHIDRKVDKVLEDIVLNSISSNNSKLILISGNVGDGKSHMLAKLFQKFPDQMKYVDVRNDATESNYVSKTWIEELDEFLTPFNDLNLTNTYKKYTKIVAINLGVLSKFLHEKAELFTQLQKFVSDKGILERLNFKNEYEIESPFQFINLADFKLFSLRTESIQSEIIDGLLKKITDRSYNNPIYNAFHEFYLDHPYRESCIMRYNYLQLSKPEIQKGLIKLIIYTLVKNKLILSIRDLLNFVYDIIVPFSYQNLSSLQIKRDLNYSNPNFQLENSYCFKLFESNNRSALFTSLQHLDPLIIREEFIDKLIFNLNSSNLPTEIFKENNVDHPPTLFNGDNIELRPAIVKLFVRELFIKNSSQFSTFFEVFNSFSNYLFAYHTGDRKPLKDLYKDIIQAIQKWNGTGRTNGEVNIPIGKHQIEYNITQKIKFTPSIKSLENNQQVINEFDYSIPIYMNVDNDVFLFVLDFALYELLEKVKEGYSPNKKDKEDHIDFQNFVNLLINKSTTTKDELIFEKVKGNKFERFELSLDEYNDYVFKRI